MSWFTKRRSSKPSPTNWIKPSLRCPATNLSSCSVLSFTKFWGFSANFRWIFSIFGRFPNKFLMNFHWFINEFASSYLFKFVILAKLNILPDWRIFKSLPRYLLFFDSIHNLSVVPIVDFFNQAHDNGHGSEVLTNCILPPLKASRVEILVVKYLPLNQLYVYVYLLSLIYWIFTPGGVGQPIPEQEAD